MSEVFDAPEPLRAWWAIASDPRGTALFIELLAAANHRPALKAEVGAIARDVRAMQIERYAAIGLPQVRTNAMAAGPVLEDVAKPDASGLSLLRDAADAMQLSARGYHRVLRVARTLADLDGADKVGRIHLAEALSYRALADEIRRAA